MNLQSENEMKIEPLISEREVSESVHAVHETDSAVLPPQIAKHVEGVQVMFLKTLIAYCLGRFFFFKSCII